MRTIASFAGLLCLFATTSCGQKNASTPVAANPYDTSGQPAVAGGGPPSRPNLAGPGAQSNPGTAGPRPGAATPHQPSQAIPVRPRTGTASRPATIPARTRPVRDSGDQAVQLTLSEYSRMARRAADMLQELTEIHIAVDESGDAGPHQDRWGELTADLTSLHREVLASGYPPADVVLHLKESWLPSLDEAIAQAAQAVQEHTSVESGFELCLNEAQEIRDHLQQSREDSSSK